MANHPNRGLPPISHTLKAYRAREGLTCEAACVRFGVPITVWRDWEQRATAPTTHLAATFAAIVSELMVPRASASSD